MVVFTLAVGILYVVASYLLAVTVSQSFMYAGAAGFSGVLFAMAVDECSLSPFPTRSVFGLFSVPTRLYPIVLMVALQLILPNVSWLGHLCGIVVGALHTTGWLRWAVPSFTALRVLEASPRIAWLVRLGSYKRVPLAEVTRESSRTLDLSTLAAGFVDMSAPLISCFRHRMSSGTAMAVPSVTRRIDSNGRVGATLQPSVPGVRIPSDVEAAAPAQELDLEARSLPSMARSGASQDARMLAAEKTAAAAAARQAAMRQGGSRIATPTAPPATSNTVHAAGGAQFGAAAAALDTLTALRSQDAESFHTDNACVENDSPSADAGRHQQRAVVRGGLTYTSVDSGESAGDPLR